eukprot:UN25608
MSDRVDELGADFVNKDDFLNTVPNQELNDLKKRLRPQFEKTYNSRYKGKVDDIIDQLEKQIFSEKEEIVLRSSSKQDCGERMCDRLVDIAQEK